MMTKTGKAQSLERLRKHGFTVPAFFICDKSWSEKSVLEKIEIILPTSIYFAVRSSAENEDSKEKSFAGHFYTGIGIAKKNVYTEITKVQKSFGDLTGSVIVQDFIASDIAGVMFSEVNKNTVVINATSGLCQAVVIGEACDEYICNKDGALLKKNISNKKTVLHFVNGKIISSKSRHESLNKSHISRLVKLASRIQKIFGSPQDIEWCFKDDKLYVLQSRSVTRDFSIGEETYFDSANIAESYSGIVLPLTCSFAKMVYEQVYKDLLQMSGVSKNKIERYSNIFENLLGFFYGRVYYNMNNWYRMAEFVPGYNRNKKNFELMITSNIRQNVVTQIKPSPVLRILYPIIVGIKIATFGFTSTRFKSQVRRHLRLLRNRDFDRLDYQELISQFEGLQKNLLRKWYVTLENDFIVMTYLGILKKFLNEESLQKAITFPSKATEQVNALAFLSKQMTGIKELWQSVQSDDVAKFHTELKNNLGISTDLDNYLHTFGGRFANELKLESIGIDEDTKKLFAVLRAYQNYEPKSYYNNLNITLPIYKKLILRVIVKKFRKYASRREEFRLLRSNTFAIARRLFRHMGTLLAEAQAIQNPDDVFYLQMNEILNPAALANNLKETVKKRKMEYASFKDIISPAHFSTTNNQLPWVQTSNMRMQQKLNGRPASPGIVKGRVKVFKEFSMPSQVDFDILVTSHTDPGWTSLIALSKGLIIEHGGVLSHASIVARELGIPAVIGVANAVDLLTDYQMVEIDGSIGTIKLI